MWPVCNKVVTSFQLQPTHEPYLPLLHSRKASPPFGWYLLRLATNLHEGMARLSWSGWLAGYIPSTEKWTRKRSSIPVLTGLDVD